MDKPVYGKRLVLPLSEELHRRLKGHCVARDLGMAELVATLVEKYLSREEKGERKEAVSDVRVGGTG